MAISYRVEEIEERDLAVLRVEGDLEFDTRTEFFQATAELFSCDRPKLVIDLSSINTMSSLYIGTLIDLKSKADGLGKSLSVVMQERLARICRKVGLEDSVAIIITKEPALREAPAAVIIGRSLLYRVEEIEERDLAVLRVEGDLVLDAYAEFSQAIAELFTIDRPKLLLDLSGVTTMRSLYIGMLIDLKLKAEGRGKSLAVVMQERLARVCRKVGGEDSVNIIIADEPDS